MTTEAQDLIEIQTERSRIFALHASGIHRECDRTGCIYWVRQVREKQVNDALGLLGDLHTLYPLIADAMEPAVAKVLTELFGHEVTSAQLEDLANALADADWRGEDGIAQQQAAIRADSLMGDITLGPIPQAQS